ncbi:MAG: YicC/YloC family endoribonuclease, partial [Duodenibacillus sp.]|nr:YicC/YloC family endoribonuclease [Duodenibacillus sp.]
DVLSYPGILANNAADPDVIQNELLAVLDRALESFCASRQREGKALADVLLKNCDQINAVVANVAAKIPEIHARFREKLAERLQEAMSETLSKNSTLSPEEVGDRIRQEVTLYALRMDVEEEINRLRTHVTEVRRVLAAGGAAGRRLDFLTQELNREANTLGSKAAAIAMTDASIALKISIDQMREQLQNIE